MGHNATVVLMVDALGDIEKDPEFGKNLAKAVRALNVRDDRQDVPAGSHANAAHVVEVHHADQTAVITVGGNLGIQQHVSYGWDHHKTEGQERLLREWAEKLGYDLTPKEEHKPAAKSGARRP